MVGKIITTFMALFFLLLYHQFAWTYDLVASVVSFGKWQEWVRSISKQLEPLPTLELGFGPGHLQQHLTSQGFPIYGLDYSSQMCRITSRRLSKAKLIPRITRSSSTSIPFPDNTFEQLIATFPSEYILLPKTLSEIRRVIKPGGKLVILAMARITGRSLPHRIMALIYQITGQTVDLKKQSLDRMLKPFSDQGFQLLINEARFANANLTFLVATLPD